MLKYLVAEVHLIMDLEIDHTKNILLPRGTVIYVANEV